MAAPHQSTSVTAAAAMMLCIRPPAAKIAYQSGVNSMAETGAETIPVRGYHAHVYYDAVTRPIAERLRERLAERFPVEFGQFSGEQVGPHPVPHFQIVFNAAQFQIVVPW